MSDEILMTSPKRIISFDGGGIRILMVIAFLNELLNERRLLDASFQIRDMVDIFIGTSAGTLLSCFLTYTVRTNESLLDILLPDIINLFRTKAGPTSLIRPKYNKDKLATILKKYFNDYTFKSPILTRKNMRDKNIMKDAPPLNIKTIRVFATAYNVNTNANYVFDSDDKDHHHLFVTDICLASGSLPSYFPPIILTIPNRDEKNDHNTPTIFIDGGITCANPLFQILMYEKGKLLKEYQSNTCQFLSIGTGRAIHKISEKDATTSSWGSLKWLNNGLLDMLSDHKHIDDALDILLSGKNYLRLNTVIDVAHSSCDDTRIDNIAYLIYKGKTLYWENHSKIWDWFGWNNNTHR